MKLIRCLLILVLFLPLVLHAEIREWTSADDPNRKFRGELKGAKDNQVAILMHGGGMAILEIDKLSKADQEFIRTRKEPGSEPAPMVSDKIPFDPDRHLATVVLDFVFGEDPDDVYVRIKKHGAIQGEITEILRGRTGLNDHFHVTIAGVRFGLFFDYDDVGLTEVNLQSEGFEPEKFNSALRDTWKEVRSGITENYGKAALDGQFPDKSTLPEGSAISTDVWKTESGKQIYLGLGFQNGRYSCMVQHRQKPFIP